MTRLHLTTFGVITLGLTWLVTVLVICSYTLEMWSALRIEMGRP